MDREGKLMFNKHCCYPRLFELKPLWTYDGMLVDNIFRCESCDSSQAIARGTCTPDIHRDMQRPV